MALSKITNASVADTAVHGRRNLLINSAMQVAQRGTSFSSISGSTYTLDRWAIRNATSVSQSTDVPSGEGFKNSLYYDNDGTRQFVNIRQPIEDVVRLADGNSLTLSFWMKSSASTTITVDFTDKTPINVSVTTSWARYVVTFSSLSNLNSTNAYEAGAGWVDFNLGSDYPDVYLTGVQLELGDKATPFEHRSFGEELALCQRYYHKSGPVGHSTEWFPGVATYASYGSHYTYQVSNNADRHLQSVQFPVYMRTRPTMTIWPGRSDATATSGRMARYNGTAITTFLGISSSTQGIADYFYSVDDDHQSYRFQYEADAEL